MLSSNDDRLLSISIVTFHSNPKDITTTLESLFRAVASLHQNYPDQKLRLDLVDNSNQVELLQQILNEQFYENNGDIGNAGIIENFESRIHCGHGNIGYGRGHNIAIRKIKSTYHLILNPDVRLEVDSLMKGIQFLDDNPQISAAAPQATNREGEIEYLCKRYPSVLDFVLRGSGSKTLRKFFSKRLDQYQMSEIIESGEVADVPIMSGCFMLCRTKDLHMVGGFDEGFFLYFEDFALSMELSKIGKLCYYPKMKIQHFGGKSSTKGLKHVMMFVKSGFKFFNKYGWKIA